MPSQSMNLEEHNPMPNLKQLKGSAERLHVLISNMTVQLIAEPLKSCWER